MKLPRRSLSRAGFVNFEWIENAIPSVAEVEDRHIEHQQWIAHSAAALEHLWQLVRETRFRSCLFLLREYPPYFNPEFIRSVSSLVRIVEFNDH
jgi:hypothetical protein